MRYVICLKAMFLLPFARSRSVLIKTANTLKGLATKRFFLNLKMAKSSPFPLRLQKSLAMSLKLRRCFLLLAKKSMQTLCMIASAGLLASALPHPVMASANNSSVPVELTSAQALALYGQTISAYYYNGSSVSTANFEFWKSSKQVVASINGSASGSSVLPSPFLTGVTVNNPGALVGPSYDNTPMSANRADISGWLPTSGVTYVTDRSLIAPYEFLIYRWQGSPNIIPDSAYDFQFNFQFPVTFTQIDGFRSSFGVSCAQYSGTSLSLSSSDNMSTYQSQFDLLSGVNSLFVTSNFVSNINSTYRIPKFCMPVTNSYEGVAFGSMNESEAEAKAFLAGTQPSMMGCYCDYHPSGSFSVDGMSLNIRRAQATQTRADGYYNPNSPNYQNTLPPTVYLYVMCPVIWGDYTPPEPPTTNPNYSDQLDDINNNVSGVNINLDAVLEKLDDIYNNMFSPNPSLSPASTLPRYDLTAVQSGLTTFDASRLGGALAGAAMVDSALSDLFTASGLSYLLPLLAGLACVGWVLTRGRN